MAFGQTVIKTSTLPAGGPVRVMVVDDSMVIRGLLTRSLETDPGIKVVVSAGNGKAAEPDFREALRYRLDGEWAPLAHDALGVIEAQRGDLRQATGEFEQAVRLRPGLVAPQRNLANALIGQGRTTDAIARLEQARRHA